MLFRILILLAVIQSLPTQVLAQFDTTRIQFDYYSYDFGAITEGPNAECLFHFTNVGTDTIRLSHDNIKSSCGCVTVEYTKTPVAPGERGYIKAYMYTKGRVGSFSKAIYYYQSKGPTLAVYLMGVIQAPVKDTVYTKAQLKASSNIETETTVYSFGKVKKKQELIASFPIQNTGKDTLKLKFDTGCHCMKFTLRDKNGRIVSYVLPGEKVVLNIVYTSYGYGPVTHYCIIQTNSLSSPVVTLTINAEILSEEHNR